MPCASRTDSDAWEARRTSQKGSEMKKVTMYTTTSCGFCRRAKSILQQQGVAFEELDVTHDAERRSWLVETSGSRTVPQIFFDEEPVGGCDDLEALVGSGKLNERLGRAPV